MTIFPVLPDRRYFCLICLTVTSIATFCLYKVVPSQAKWAYKQAHGSLVVIICIAKRQYTFQLMTIPQMTMYCSIQFNILLGRHFDLLVGHMIHKNVIREGILIREWHTCRVTIPANSEWPSHFKGLNSMVKFDVCLEDDFINFISQWKYRLIVLPNCIAFVHFVLKLCYGLPFHLEGNYAATLYSAWSMTSSLQRTPN